MKILIVEDDRAVGRLLARVLEQEGYAVDFVDSGEEGRTLAWVHDYDGIVLDLELPDRHGITILQELRRAGDATPVLILTGRADEEAVVRGLDAGADDYVGKPVSNAEFRARVRALVRRGGARRTEQLTAGDLRLNRLTHQVFRGTEELELTPTEFQILEHFMLRTGEVVPRTELLEKVWDVNFDPSSNVVDVHLARLRKKLRDAGVETRLKTVRGVGVKLVPAETAS
ncbi:MAG: response regulator transcription factor [Gemmatimonadetes bacterium]|nr:response regulator transcription factor [Gemmatimonadota bacterium]